MITRKITLSPQPNCVTAFFTAPLRKTGRLKNLKVNNGAVEIIGEFADEKNYFSFLMAVFLVLKGIN